MSDQPRTILVHVNVQVPADDPRPADALGSLVEDALTVGLEGADGANGLVWCVPLVDEV